MLDWIRNMVAGATSAETKSSDQKWDKYWGEYFKPLDALGRGRIGLAQDVISFLRQGEPSSVLSEIAGIGYASQELERTAGSRLYEIKKDFYPGFNDLSDAEALRWALVLDACNARRSSFGHSLSFPGGITWPQWLLQDFISIPGSDKYVYLASVSHQKIERLLDCARIPSSSLLVAAFTTPFDYRGEAHHRRQLITSLSDYSAAVTRHAESLRPHLLSSPVDVRIHMLELLKSAGAEAIAALAPELAQLATGTSKQVRDLAETLVAAYPDQLVDSVKSLARDGKLEQRINALRLLWTFARLRSDSELQNFTIITAKSDKTPHVRDLLAEWDDALQPAGGNEEENQYKYELPSIEWNTDLSPELLAALDQLWRALNAGVDLANKQSREFHAECQAKKYDHTLRLEPEYSRDELTRLHGFIAAPSTDYAFDKKPGRCVERTRLPLARFAANPVVTPAVAIKTMVALDIIAPGRQPGEISASIYNTLKQVGGRPSLLEIQLLLEPFGVSPSLVLESYRTHPGLGVNWSDDDVWPFFAHNADLLAERFISTIEGDHARYRKRLYRAISTLPEPPKALVRPLFEIALGVTKRERFLAQDALNKHPGKERRIIEALSDREPEKRTVAARWLETLRYAPAVAGLEAALAKEKLDIPKGAMIDALQGLGQPVEKYFDRAALTAEAKKFLAKPLSGELEWFPWMNIPEVRWANNGERVDNAVLRWMLVQAVKQKSPEPNAILRKYCSMFNERDRENFGQFVLEAWLQEDTRPMPLEEAMRLAHDRAQSHKQYWLHLPPDLQKLYPDGVLSIDELTIVFLPNFQKDPIGTAIGSKGLLAVAAACAGERAAAPVQRFLKVYYGTRLAQGKALIAMLAWIEHRSATQLLLSVGNRFRTKALQDEATKQADALAERKGWTITELADRTIPSGGFDESGILELRYGPRSFVARLLPNFKVELINESGKTIASLPEPREQDDAELAKDAKKAVSLAKKEIKSVVELQTERLYEAFCTERDWLFDDWNEYLNRHPVVRYLVQRLVWAETSKVDGVVSVVKTFRPLADGSLTDAGDNEVQIPPDAHVRIADDWLLSPELVEEWKTHFADYKVSPLFPHLGANTYVFPPNKAHADSVCDFEGHLIEAYALRNQATKLGYTRGAEIDSAWFIEYEKRFSTLGIVAAIEFTGNRVPEENRVVALISLSFKTEFGLRLMLEKVPRVLLSECYNHLRMIASAGSGFDPDWHQESQY